MTAMVTVAEVRRAVKAPDDGTGRLLAEFAADLGVTLTVSEDWAGSPAVPVEQAAAFIAAIEAQHAERMTQKRRAQVEHDQASWADETERLAGASRTFDAVLIRELSHGHPAKAELAAFEAATSVAAGKAAPVSVEAGMAAHEALVRGGLRKPKRRWLR